jgi:hypothetical protein
LLNETAELRIAKLNSQTGLPNWIAELNCQTKLPNWIAKLNYQTELLKLWKMNCSILI